MKVLHVLEAVDAGTARHVIDVCRHVTGVDHTVALPDRRRGAPSDATVHQRLRDAGAALHSLDMHRSPGSPRNAAAAAALRRLVSRSRPDVVHTHSSIAGVAGRVATVGLSSPVVHTAHGIAASRAGRRIERTLRRRADVWIAVSPSEADLAVALGLTDPDRVRVIPNGVDVDAEIPPLSPGLRARLGIGTGSQLVVMAARLVDQKDPMTFARAAATAARSRPSAHWVLLGDGPLRSEVERFRARERLDRLHVLGSVDGAAGALPEVDVFVLPSRFEGASYAALEAMHAARPVVLTDVVGNRDLVPTAGVGALVPPEDPGAVADAVGAYLDDPRRATATGSAARAHVRRHHDVRTSASALTRVYRQVSGVRTPKNH